MSCWNKAAKQVHDFNQITAFCPRFGNPCFPQKSPGFFRCEACDFHYPNCSVGVVGIIVNAAGKILLVRQNREPGENKWSVPGAFVDNDETAEGTLARELFPRTFPAPRLLNGHGTGNDGT